MQVLDRFESEAAKNYAEAIAALAKATDGVDHAYLVAKNTVVLKTVEDAGGTFLGGRVLTAREVGLYESGALNSVLAVPASAVAFVRSGELPPGAVAQPAIEPTLEP